MGLHYPDTWGRDSTEIFHANNWYMIFIEAIVLVDVAELVSWYDILQQITRTVELFCLNILFQKST